MDSVSPTLAPSSEMSFLMSAKPLERSDLRDCISSFMSSCVVFNISCKSDLERDIVPSGSSGADVLSEIEFEGGGKWSFIEGSWAEVSFPAPCLVRRLILRFTLHFKGDYSTWCKEKGETLTTFSTCPLPLGPSSVVLLLHFTCSYKGVVAWFCTPLLAFPPSFLTLLDSDPTDISPQTDSVEEMYCFRLYNLEQPSMAVNTDRGPFPQAVVSAK